MRLKAFLSIVAAVSFITPAFPSSLQDWEFNINGTDYYPAGGSTLASVPGLNASAFNTTTSTGNLTITFNPGAAGNYYIGAWFFDPVGIPFYNEYGTVNGTAASGQSWQVDIPEYDTVSPNHGSGTILDNLASGTLNNTNSVPGIISNYLNNCGANGGGTANAACNDLVSMAQGFNFTLTANQTETITFTLSSTNPGGFSLEDVHPVDGSNATESDVYLSGTVGAPPPPPPTTPEPAAWSLLATGGGLLAFALKRRGLRS